MGYVRACLHLEAARLPASAGLLELATLDGDLVLFTRGSTTILQLFLKELLFAFRWQSLGSVQGFSHFQLLLMF